MKRFFAIIVVLILALSFTACGETYTLEGKWRADISVLGFSTAYPETTYVMVEFKDDGSGFIDYVNLGFEAYPDDFTYVVNESTLTITTETDEVYECVYEIKGDTLVFTDSFQTVECTRIK